MNLDGDCPTRDLSYFSSVHRREHFLETARRDVTLVLLLSYSHLSTTITTMAFAAMLPIPRACKVFSPKDFWSTTVFISNVIGSYDYGHECQVKKVCRDDDVSVDGYVPPNINFEIHRNHLLNIKLYNDQKTKLKHLVGDKAKSVIGGVLVTNGALSHIFSKHTFNQSSPYLFMIQRQSPHFRIEANVSVFIHRDVVLPVIRATLEKPDKIIYNRVLGGNTRYEKMFDSEIGHGVGGCHFIATVVIKVDTKAEKRVLVTAYTLPSFSPTLDPSE